MGSVGVRIVEDRPRTASFGCELKREHWGQGYAYEAARALIGFAFFALGVERIFAETSARNTAALGLARKLGMRPAPELETSQDRATSSLMLAIWASDWTA
jgi:RimJ/RimL family protein N-acetyltransferase